MRNILNIVLGDMSTGELGIALSFVKGQDKIKYNYSFLIPEEKIGILDGNMVNTYTLSKKNSPIENQQIINKIIFKLAPELIILFDAFTFEYAQNWTGYNMKMLKETNILIASIDEYEYTQTEYKIDYYGIFVKKLPNLLSCCDYVLKNCPLSMPKENSKKNFYYYRALNGWDSFNEAQRREYRIKVLGKQTEDAKVVFFTTSAWEVEGAYSFACQNELAKWLGPMLFNYLSDLNEKIVLFHVGKENWEIASNDNVIYTHIDSLPIEDFEKRIQMSDLFVTYNIVSISLSKAILFNVPSIVLNNNKIIEFEKLSNALKQRPQWYQNMARDVKKVYPIRASLFGWFSFLRNCLDKNKYVETFNIAEVFNYKKTLELLHKVLLDSDYRNEMVEKQKSFAKYYKTIRDAESTIDEILS